MLRLTLITLLLLQCKSLKNNTYKHRSGENIKDQKEMALNDSMKNILEVQDIKVSWKQYFDGLTLLNLSFKRKNSSVFIVYEFCRERFKAAKSDKHDCIKGQAHDGGKVDLTVNHTIVQIPKGLGAFSFKYHPCHYEEKSTKINCGDPKIIKINTPTVSEFDTENYRSLVKQEKLEQNRFKLAEELRKISVGITSGMQRCEDKKIIKTLDKSHIKIIKDISSMAVSEVLKNFSNIEDTLKIEKTLLQKEFNNLETENKGENKKTTKEKSKYTLTSLLILKSITLLATSAAVIMTIKNAFDWEVFLTKKRKIIDPDDIHKSLELVNNKKTGELTIKGGKYKDCRFIEDPYTRDLYQISGGREFNSYENGEKIPEVSIDEGFKYKHGYLTQGEKRYFIKRDKLGKFEIPDIKTGVNKKLQLEYYRDSKTPISKNDVFNSESPYLQQKIKTEEKLNKLRNSRDPQSGGLVKEKYGKTFRKLVMTAAVSGLSLSIYAFSESLERVVESHKSLSLTGGACSNLVEKLNEFKKTFFTIIDVSNRLFEARLSFAEKN